MDVKNADDGVQESWPLLDTFDRIHHEGRRLWIHARKSVVSGRGGAIKASITYMSRTIGLGSRCRA